MKNWSNIKIEKIKLLSPINKPLALGDKYTAEIEVYLDGISIKDIAIEIVFIEKRDELEETKILFTKELELLEERGNTAIFSCEIPMIKPGVFEHSFRIYPSHPLLANRQDFPLIKWA